ncbi:hypothetical protein YB2330_002817 [Saitoella coloradoensis]
MSSEQTSASPHRRRTPFSWLSKRLRSSASRSKLPTVQPNTAPSSAKTTVEDAHTPTTSTSPHPESEIAAQSAYELDPYQNSSVSSLLPTEEHGDADTYLSSSYVSPPLSLATTNTTAPTDGLSIMTLASSSRRLSRATGMEDASVRAIAPSSIYPLHGDDTEYDTADRRGSLGTSYAGPARRESVQTTSRLTVDTNYDRRGSTQSIPPLSSVATDSESVRAVSFRDDASMRALPPRSIINVNISYNPSNAESDRASISSSVRAIAPHSILLNDDASLKKTTTDTPDDRSARGSVGSLAMWKRYASQRGGGGGDGVSVVSVDEDASVRALAPRSRGGSLINFGGREGDVEEVSESDAGDEGEDSRG